MIESEAEITRQLSDRFLAVESLRSLASPTTSSPNSPASPAPCSSTSKPATPEDHSTPGTASPTPSATRSSASSTNSAKVTDHRPSTRPLAHPWTAELTTARPPTPGRRDPARPFRVMLLFQVKSPRRRLLGALRLHVAIFAGRIDVASRAQSLKLLQHSQVLILVSFC